MLLLWGTLSISRSIDSLFLVFDVTRYFRLHILLLLLQILVVVLDSLLRRPQFLCTVWVVSRGTRCEFSRLLVASTSMSPILLLLWFWTALPVLVRFSYDSLSLRFLCQAKLSLPSWMVWRWFFVVPSSVHEPVHELPMLLLFSLSDFSSYPQSSETLYFQKIVESLLGSFWTSIQTGFFVDRHVFNYCVWIQGCEVPSSILLGVTLVFAGPVLRTGKRPQLDRTATKKNQFVSNWF